jgi:predicted RNA-binding protein with PUA-like domain
MAGKSKTGYWLFKQEPSCYSYADLEREGRTLWDGVANALALKYLSQVRHGDRVYFYHTGKEKAVVGEMRVVQVGDANEKPFSVEVAPVRRLDNPVTLARIKVDTQLREWDLLRLPRLSVLPMTARQWQRIQELSTKVTHTEETT